MKELSIVIPVYNEEGNIKPLFAKLSEVLKRTAKSYECIFVDDGSRDDSWKVLKEIRRADHNVKIIKFKKNFGQTQAMAAGFDAAQGDVIITMDADQQNDPDDIPLLIRKLNEGYDVVSGWRDKRKDPWLKRRLPSYLANKMISRLTGIKLHDFGCTLKAYRREVLKNIRLYGDMHRFLPAIASFSGIRIAEIRVRHHNREYGVSKYGISRVLKVLLDLITVKFFLSYAASPMRLFGIVGFISMLSGAGFLAASFYMKFHADINITGNPIFYMTIVMLVVGAQCILMGILGEMNVRIYHELLDKHSYTIEETL